MKLKLTIYSLLIVSIFNVKTVAQNYNWNTVSIGGGGFVSGLITSKTQANVMYARTDVGGAYRWDATNSTWIPLTDWASENETTYLGVESIAIDPQASNKLYMLAGTDYFNGGKTAILRSTDYGATFAITEVTSQFKAHGNGMGRQSGEKLIVDPNNGNTLFCGTRRNGLFKSTDAGLTWTQNSSLGTITTSNDNGITFVVIDKSSGTTGNNSQKIYVGVSRSGSTNLYVSTNGGTTFTAVSGAPTNFMPQRAVLATDGNMYITYANGAGPYGSGSETMDSGAIWKYNTATGVWTNTTPTGITKPFSGISVDPSNANRLVASTINTWMLQYGAVYGDRIFVSTNGGSSWTDVINGNISFNDNGQTWINGNSIHWTGSVEFNPFNTSQVFVASGNGIFSCDNVNTSPTAWKFNAKGLEETVPLDIASITGGPLITCIYDYDGFVHADVTKAPTIHTPKIGTTTGIAFAAGNTSKLLRVGGDSSTGGKMYYSTNQGGAWTQCSSVSGYQGKVALSADGNTLFHGPATSSTLYRSTNNGSSWSACSGISILETVPVTDMVNANKVYAYDPNSGNFLISTNAGSSFSVASSIGTYGSKIVRTVPGKEGHIWAALNGNGLKRSTNSGSTFTTISGVTSCAAVGFGKASPSGTYHTIYIWGTVGGVLGIHRSTDEGATWTRINDDAHEFGGLANGQFVIGDMNTYGRVFVSTAGRGIVYGDQSTTTSNAAPTVSITAPTNNASFTAPATISLTATAGDSDGTVSKVEFYNGSTLLNTDTTSPYTYSWTSVAAGTYTITAKATDNAGAVTTSTAITVTVTAAANVAPTVSVTAPTNNASFTAPATISLTATAADSDGTVSKVEFYNGSTLLGSDTTSPYEYSWASVAAGTYTITAKATDNAGAVTTSTAITVTVTTATNVAPTVSITAPTNNASFTAPATISLTATAADSDGTVSKVEFYNGSTLLNTDTTSPYTYSWGSVAAGIYTITAKATDNAGAVTTSTAITVTVTAAANVAPTVSITAPANNASFTAPATISLTATAADSDGTVSKVEFYNGSTLLNTDTTSPYTYSWASVAAGTYTLTAKATDNAGAVTTSTAITVTVTATTTITNNCAYGTPSTAAIATINKSFSKVYKLGSGGPSLSNVTDLSINWDLAANGLWQMSFSTNNGVPGWWFDLRTVSTSKFNQASPEITFTNSGFADLDGSYWVTVDNGNFVMVSKTGGFTLYFSNSATAPTCTTTTKKMIDNSISNVDSSNNNVTLYPNPFNNVLNVKVNKLETIVDIQLFNQIGNLVLTVPKHKIGHENQIENILPTGLYLLKINYIDTVETFKIIKK